MDISTIVEFTALIASAIVAAVWGTVQTKKKKDTAKCLTATVAHDFLYQYMKKQIVKSEKAYSCLKHVAGMEAGAFKKEWVMQKMQVFALANGIAFDEMEWSNIVEEEIGFANVVNSDKKEG